MYIRYYCSTCNKEYSTKQECLKHEKCCQNNEYNCDSCKNSYYVYGCEIHCELNECKFERKVK